MGFGVPCRLIRTDPLGAHLDYFEIANCSKADALAAALLPLPNGLNITSDLIQVRKVMTGQQS
jgi:hypothetical protein